MKSLIPPLAGLCSYADATRVGYGVDQTVELLQRYQYIESQMVKVACAHLNGVPHWEVKCAICQHLWQDAEHCQWMRNRITEMRTPPLNLDAVPDPALEAFFAELIHSTSELRLLVGVYRVLKPALIAAITKHRETANPIADQPSIRLLEFVLMEETRQVDWGEQAIAALVSLEKDDILDNDLELNRWKSHLEAYLQAAGGVTNDLSLRLPPEQFPPSVAKEPYEPCRKSCRDGRFSKVWNSRGVWPELGSMAKEEANWHQLYVRLTEMHVPELIALIMYDWKGMPWEFYHDLARHLWDECRHSMLGESAFEKQGLDWTDVPHEVSFAEYPNNNLEPKDRYVLLWGIEQGAMQKVGKRREFETAKSSGDPLSTTFHDFDWADEVLHVQISRRWLTPEYGSRDAMKEASDRVRAGYDRVIRADAELPRSDWWKDYFASVIEPRLARQVVEG